MVGDRLGDGDAFLPAAAAAASGSDSASSSLFSGEDCPASTATIFASCAPRRVAGCLPDLLLPVSSCFCFTCFFVGCGCGGVLWRCLFLIRADDFVRPGDLARDDLDC